MREKRRYHRSLGKSKRISRATMEYIPPVKYDVIEYKNGVREIEFKIGWSILSYAEFQKIIAEEFQGKTPEEMNSMTFHAEEGILVFGEVDWA